MQSNSQICAVVLAAGKGTRMKSELPKVAAYLSGKPLIRHVVDNLRAAGVHDIVTVVGYKKETVISLLSDYAGMRFSEQKEQLGTGHALLCTEDYLNNFKGQILVCCGDMPLISVKTFKNLMQTHISQGNVMTVLSAVMENPTGYGRLIRNSKSELQYIVEEKDANAEEKSVKEVNTGTYIFNSSAVYKDLKLVKSNNAQGEYYLPDLVKIYKDANGKVGALKLSNAVEASGVNSPEDLANLEQILRSGKV